MRKSKDGKLGISFIIKKQQNNCSSYLILLSEAVQVVSHAAGI